MKIIKIGNSKGIILGRLLDLVDIDLGDEVKVEIKDNKIIIKKKNEKE